jgi:hypothetical protein
MRRDIALILFLAGLSMVLIPGLVPLVLGARSFQLRVAHTAPLTELDPQLVLDEQFADNRRGWPDDPGGTVSLEGGAYRLQARFAGRFVAVRAPAIELGQDVLISVTFHKVGGPEGGAYGLIVRDQSQVALDGRRQDGEYYLFAAGDAGLVGIRWRNENVWVDLLPWSANSAVRPGKTPNQLTVRAIGTRFTFEVNGVEVADITDATLHGPHMGLFVGGDANEVVAERLVVRRLSMR